MFHLHYRSCLATGLSIHINFDSLISSTTRKICILYLIPYSYYVEISFSPISPSALIVYHTNFLSCVNDYIEDNMATYWRKFIPPNISAIQSIWGWRNFCQANIFTYTIQHKTDNYNMLKAHPILEANIQHSS